MFILVKNTRNYCLRCASAKLVPSLLTVTMQSSDNKMASPDYLSYGFSVIVALGGVIGYVKAGWC